MVVDDNDSGTFRPVAIVIVGRAEINASGLFLGAVTSVEEMTCNAWAMKLSIQRQLPTTA